MKHGMGIDVLSCPRCLSRWKPIGLITELEGFEKILVHVPLPLRPEQLHDGMTIVYDVTGEPVFDEVCGARSEDDEWATARGPPGEWDGVDVAWDDRGGISLAADAFVSLDRSNAQIITGSAVHKESRTRDIDRFYTTRERQGLDAVQAIGLSLGGEVPLSAQVALRAGGFTDRANTPAFNAGNAEQMLSVARYDRIGATLGLGFAAGSFDSTVGLLYTRGKGKFVVGDATSDAAFAAGHPLMVLADSTEDTVAIVLSGAVTTEEAKATLRESAPASELPAGVKVLP